MLSLLLVLLASPASPQDRSIHPADQQLASPAAPALGRALALDGDRALATSAAGVHVLEQGPGGWSEVDLLTGSLVTGNADDFGAALVLEGDLAFVGTPRQGQGVVYVFERQGGAWTETAMLTVDDQNPGSFAFDEFGRDVDYDPVAERLAVGAPQSDAFANEAGAAYVFERVGGAWTPVATLGAPNPVLFDNFGASVGIDGSRVLVGAPGNFLDTGAVHQFTAGPGGWNFDRTLQPQGPPGSGTPLPKLFGSSLDMEGDRVVIGSPESLFHGAVWLMEWDGANWETEAILVPATSNQNRVGDGGTLSLQGDRVVLGDRTAKRASLFVRQGAGDWDERVRFDPVGSGSPQVFGHSVALDGSTLMVATPFASTFGTFGDGAVYVFEGLGSSFVGESLCPGDVAAGNCACGWNSRKPNGPGCQSGESAGALLLGHGSASLAANAFGLAGFGLPPNVPCVLFSGSSGTGGTPFGNGLLCVAPPVRRLAAVQVDAHGELAFDGSTPLFHGATVGSDRHYQLWYRDTTSGCPNGFNLSNAFRLPVEP